MKKLACLLGAPSIAMALVGLLGATSAKPAYHVDDSRGDDHASGSARAPWKTIERANRVPPGSIVRIAPGSYHDAPTAARVTFLGADETDKRPRVVRHEVSLRARGTRIVGFTLEQGLAFEDGARDNVVDRCVVRDHWRIQGAREAAPRNNRITRSRLDVGDMTAHTYGDDRDRTVARIVAPMLEDCDVTVTRTKGVLWRWSGVDDARIVRTTIRLVNGGNHAGEDASWKWFYVRRALIADSRIVLDHAADFSETGPFAPMWRDSTWGVRMIRTIVEAKRGGMIFSPNTAGSWGCSCGGHRFERVTLRAPGRLWFYQCPRLPSDVWVRSEAYAGRFEKYNTGTMPSGLRIRPYAAR